MTGSRAGPSYHVVSEIAKSSAVWLAESISTRDLGRRTGWLQPSGLVESASTSLPARRSAASDSFP